MMAGSHKVMTHAASCGNFDDTGVTVRVMTRGDSNYPELRVQDEGNSPDSN